MRGRRRSGTARQCVRVSCALDVRRHQESRAVPALRAVCVVGVARQCFRRDDGLGQGPCHTGTKSRRRSGTARQCVRVSCALDVRRHQEPRAVPALRVVRVVGIARQCFRRDDGLGQGPCHTGTKSRRRSGTARQCVRVSCALDVRRHQEPRAVPALRAVCVVGVARQCFRRDDGLGQGPCHTGTKSRRRSGTARQCVRVSCALDVRRHQEPRAVPALRAVCVVGTARQCVRVSCALDVRRHQEPRAVPALRAECVVGVARQCVRA